MDAALRGACIVQKTLTFMGIKPEDMVKDGVNMHALWAFAHGVDTRRCLAFFQANDDNSDNSVAQRWSGELSTRLTRELLARFKSPPAGAKAQYNIHAVMKKLATSPYALLCTPQMAVEYAQFRDWDEKYAGNRMALHIGVNYLCGERVEAPQTYSEDTILLASAYIRGACPKSTLSSAKAGLVDSAGSNEAARVMEIRRTPTKTVADDDLREALQSHVNLDGNPFALLIPNAFASRAHKRAMPAERKAASPEIHDQSSSDSDGDMDEDGGGRPKRLLASDGGGEKKSDAPGKATGSGARPPKKRME